MKNLDKLVAILFTAFLISSAYELGQYRILKGNAPDCLIIRCPEVRHPNADT